MRRNRRRSPTPKGEAKRSLDHVKVLSEEISKLSEPGHENLVVHRLNDFLRAARTAREFLEKEEGRGAGLKEWVIAESEKLESSDPRYAHLILLRTISSHDLNVQPGRSDISVKISEQLKLSGNVEGVVRDKAGRKKARIYSTGSPGDEVTVGETEVTIRYFLSDWPDEDIAAFCQESAKTLENFVNRAYANFP